MEAAQGRLDALWPSVHERLPAPPARVIEVGCGPLGGFVPMLLGRRYEAIGVDPAAPDGAAYRRVEFERVEPLGHADAVVASTSLHHVADPVIVIDRIAATLRAGGTLLVVEWDWRRFDAPTAEWCFGRLDPDETGGWLRHHRDAWLSSDEPWPTYLAAWARREHIHPAETLVRLLDERFEREHVDFGPHFFSDLAGTSEAEEQLAIDTGQIQATRVDYVARLS
jgi:SAM-dependent methyltransferase